MSYLNTNKENKELPVQDSRVEGYVLISSCIQNCKRKTRDLFKKIRDAKGTFHAKTGTIKDRNGMDLTEAKDVKKRIQEELCRKDLHDMQMTPPLWQKAKTN